MKKVFIQVPATSANCGPGFDTLGLACNLYNEVSYEITDKKGFQLEVEGEGADYLKPFGRNLAFASFLRVWNAVTDGQRIGLKVKMLNRIPMSRGLGSSSSAIVAGLFAANALCDDHYTKDELLDIATEIEGHPDNVAPAIFGALCVSFMEEGHASMIRYGIKKDMHFIAIIPDYEVKTEDARKVLPTQMSYHDAVYQMGRCAAFAKALEIGNMLIVKKACKDKMQEPYRKQLIPEYDKIRALCERFGADTMFLSGSGSTMMALTREEECAMQLKKQLQIQYPAWDLRILHATYDGVQSEVL